MSSTGSISRCCLCVFDLLASCCCIEGLMLQI
jgi:hypothetical protein